jgi:hypothetical protein
MDMSCIRKQRSAKGRNMNSIQLTDGHGATMTVTDCSDQSLVEKRWTGPELGRVR